MIGIQASVIERSNHVSSKGAKCGVVGMGSNGVQAVANRLPAPKHSNGFKRFTVPVSHKSPNDAVEKASSWPDRAVNHMEYQGSNPHWISGAATWRAASGSTPVPRFLAGDLAKQLLPGSFECAMHHLFEHDINLGGFAGDRVEYT